MGRGYFFHYPLQVMVVLFCKILTYWVYIAVFLLIGVLVRRRFLSFALSFRSLPVHEAADGTAGVGGRPMDSPDAVGQIHRQGGFSVL